MSPKQRDRIATILVEAAARGDRETAEKFATTVRSIQRYRLKLATDEELSRLVASRKATVEQGWAAGLAEVLKKQIEFLGRAADKADPADPEAITAVSEAMAACSEVAATWKMLDVRLSRPTGTAPTEARPSAAGGSSGGAAGRPGGAGAPN